MPIIPNDTAPEVPWRPGYRSFTLANRDQGMSCVSTTSLIEPGSGAPLHVHDDVDEVLILVEGELEFRLGDDTHRVPANHTIAIPAGTPHGFVAVGDRPARFYAFFPSHGAILRARYLEGEPPQGAASR
jgi:quercetin dioxygenase-like cupin family protein